MKRGIGCFCILAVAFTVAPPIVHGPAADASTASSQLSSVLERVPGPIGSVGRLGGSLHSRNGVYREAGRTQAEIRDYYDRLIATAEREVDNREQLGLAPAQIAAYERAAATYKREKDAALALTEVEKKAARDRFLRTVRREITNVVLQAPGVVRALGDLKERIDDIRQSVNTIRTTIDTGNPFSALIDEARQKLDRLARVREYASAIHGPASRNLGRLERRLRGIVDRLDRPREQASGALDEVTALLDSADEAVASLDRPRQQLSDVVFDAVIDRVDRIFTPGGDAPNEEVVTETVMEILEREFPNVFGDPAELARMRDRVRATLNQQTLVRIATKCGRIVGFLQRQRLEGGDQVEFPEDSPCKLFDEDTLQDLLDSGSDEDQGQADDEPEETEEPIDEGVALPSVWRGTTDLAASNPILREVIENTVTLMRDGDTFTFDAVAEWTQGVQPGCEFQHRTEFHAAGVEQNGTIKLSGDYTFGAILTRDEHAPEGIPISCGATSDPLTLPDSVRSIPFAAGTISGFWDLGPFELTPG